MLSVHILLKIFLEYLLKFCYFFNSVNLRAATGKRAVHGLLIAALTNMKFTAHQWMDVHVGRNEGSQLVKLTEQGNRMKNFNYEIDKSLLSSKGCVTETEKCIQTVTGSSLTVEINFHS